jgi:hypothetical protein
MLNGSIFFMLHCIYLFSPKREKLSNYRVPTHCDTKYECFTNTQNQKKDYILFNKYIYNSFNLAYIVRLKYYNCLFRASFHISRLEARWQIGVDLFGIWGDEWKECVATFAVFKYYINNSNMYLLFWKYTNRKKGFS